MQLTRDLFAIDKFLLDFRLELLHGKRLKIDGYIQRGVLFIMISYTKYMSNKEKKKKTSKKSYIYIIQPTI